MRKSKVQIGIIGAMQIEVEGLKKSMTNTSTEVISGIEFTSGILNGKTVVAAVCGIGKVFAAICAQTMILKYNPDVIINSGVAGTLTDKLAIGDVAVSSDVVQHDMDTTAIGDELGLISGINIIHIPANEKAAALLKICAAHLRLNSMLGTIATGDCFLNDTARKNDIASTFSAIACEMEGGGIGQTCYVNKIPFAILRVISDGGNESSHLDYPTFAKMAAERSIEIMEMFISRWE